jgi:hypothetical protein
LIAGIAMKPVVPEQIVEIIAAIAMAGFLARWNTTLQAPLEQEPLATGRKHLAPGAGHPVRTHNRPAVSAFGQTGHRADIAE